MSTDETNQQKTNSEPPADTVKVFPTWDIQLETLADMVEKIASKKRKMKKYDFIKIMNIVFVLISALFMFCVGRLYPQIQSTVDDYNKIKDMGPILKQISKLMGPMIDPENSVEQGRGIVRAQYFLTTTDLTIKQGESIHIIAGGGVYLDDKNKSAVSLPYTEKWENGVGLRVVIGSYYTQPIGLHHLSGKPDGYFEFCLDSAPRDGPVYLAVPDGKTCDWQEILNNVYADNSGEFKIKEIEIIHARNCGR